MVCATVGRYYIQEKVYDEFVEKFISEAKRIVIGDPLDEATDMGQWSVKSIENRL